MYESSTHRPTLHAQCECNECLYVGWANRHAHGVGTLLLVIGIGCEVPEAPKWQWQNIPFFLLFSLFFNRNEDVCRRQYSICMHEICHLWNKPEPEACVCVCAPRQEANFKIKARVLSKKVPNTRTWFHYNYAYSIINNNLMELLLFKRVLWLIYSSIDVRTRMGAVCAVWEEGRRDRNTTKLTIPEALTSLFWFFAF